MTFDIETLRKYANEVEAEISEAAHKFINWVEGKHAAAPAPAGNDTAAGGANTAG